MGINYGRQHIDDDDIHAVVNVLKSDFLTQGPSIQKFEKEFAKQFDAKFAIAVNNGTAALHLAMLALDLKPGEKIVTTPMTFAATANAAIYCGADVVFCDIDPETLLISHQKLKETLLNDPTIKGITVVSYRGLPNDMERLREIADQFDCWLIEDGCHSPGAQFKNSQDEWVKSGSGKYADATTFSFHPVKHIACGEGGMITTSREELLKKFKNSAPMASLKKKLT